MDGRREQSGREMGVRREMRRKECRHRFEQSVPEQTNCSGVCVCVCVCACVSVCLCVIVFEQAGRARLPALHRALLPGFRVQGFTPLV